MSPQEIFELAEKTADVNAAWLHSVQNVPARVAGAMEIASLRTSLEIEISRAVSVDVLRELYLAVKAAFERTPEFAQESEEVL